MGLANQIKLELIDRGLESSSTPLDKTMFNYLRFSKITGRLLGRYSGLVYGVQAYDAYNNGDRLHIQSNGLMSFYSIVAAKVGTIGTIFTAPFFFIDWTVGMDNFLLFDLNYGIEQSNQIQNGNWGVSLWRPGQGLR